jgi:hypothetical protein
MRASIGKAGEAFARSKNDQRLAIDDHPVRPGTD